MASDSGSSQEQTSDDAAGELGADDAPNAAVPDSTAATTAPGGAEAGGGGQPSDSASPSAGRLGTVEKTSELAQQIATYGRPPGSLSASESDGDFGEPSSVFDEEGTCPGLSEDGDPTRGRAVLVADAIFQGTPVRVHVYENADGSQQLVATDQSCFDLVDTPYEP
jgi:hypothetical protein